MRECSSEPVTKEGVMCECGDGYNGDECRGQNRLGA